MYNEREQNVYPAGKAHFNFANSPYLRTITKTPIAFLLYICYNVDNVEQGER